MPVLVLTEGLTIAANQFLGIDPFLKVLTPVAIAFMCFALVGLAIGYGARYPRFNADNVTQVAGSPGGIAFMIWAVGFILVVIATLAWGSSIYLWRRDHDFVFYGYQRVSVIAAFAGPAALSVFMWLRSMRDGIRALDAMDRTPG